MEWLSLKPTPLTSTTLDKVAHVLDHRCIVGGGEQLFLLSLGVSTTSVVLICRGRMYHGCPELSAVVRAFW